MWQAISAEVDPLSGRLTQRKSSFVELGTGLNYRDGTGWHATQEIFLIAPDGTAVAEFGPHRLVVKNNLNSPDFIDFTGPDGVRIRCGPVAIGYYDPVDGRNLILATVRDTAGQLTAANEVTFADGFEGLSASVRVRYHRAGMSHALVLHEAPVAPTALGLSAKSRLELYTDFMAGTPAPTQIGRVISREDDAQAQGMVEPSFNDAMMDFGAYKMGVGIAFDLNAAGTDGNVPVGKQFALIGERAVLIEAVKYGEAEKLLVGLPRARGDALMAQQNRDTPRDGLKPGRQAATLARYVPERLRPGPVALQAQVARNGFVLDWSLMTGATNFTLGNETYFVSSDVYLYGKTTVLPGAVVKHTNWTTYNSIHIAGTVDCLTTATRPWVLTSQNDDTVGERLPWSSGNPHTNFFGNPALQIEYYTSNAVATLQHVRVAHAAAGISFYGGYGHIARHVQAIRCNIAFQPYYADVWIQNALVTDADRIFGNSNTSTGRVEHLTAHRVNRFSTDTNLTGYVTNSLLVAVTNLGTFSGSHNATNSSDAGVFETIGGGRYYLSGNTYRDIGTTNVAILSDIRQRTTYAPTVLTNQITTSTNLSPIVARDDGHPDCGWHYFSVDFAVSLIVSNATLKIDRGTSIATFGEYGIRVHDTAQLITEGWPLEPVNLSRNYALQEQSTNWGGVLPYQSYTVLPYHFGANLPTGSFRFTHFNGMASCGHHIYNYEPFNFASLTLRDCTANAGVFAYYTSTGTTVTMQNNLLEGVTTYFEGDFGLNLYNNLWKGGLVDFTKDGASTWAAKDNAFDGATVSDSLSGLTHSHNAYINASGRLIPTNANDIVLTNFTYDVGPLGRFYHWSSSPLTNGSRTADLAGLWHFTTRTNQIAETNSMVDPGFHYVALGIGSVPVNSDSDQLENWLEDTDGDGVKDASESNILLTDTEGDGLNDAEEFSLGTDYNAANTFVLRITDAVTNDLSSPVTTNQVARRVDLKSKAWLDSGTTNIPGITNQWTIGGQRIKSYDHDVDEVTPQSPSTGGDPDPARHRHMQIPLTASDLTTTTTNGMYFFWQAPTNVSVTLTVSKGFFARQANLVFDVAQLSDASRDLYTWLAVYDTVNYNNMDDADARRSPDGLLLTNKVLKSHAHWHSESPADLQPGQVPGTTMADGEGPVPFYPSISNGQTNWSDPYGGESYWGDLDRLRLTYNGSAFLQWHRAFLDAHIAWRNSFNVPAVQVGVFPDIPANERNYTTNNLRLPEYLKQNPSPWPPAPPQNDTGHTPYSSIHRYVRLGEFQNLDQLGRGLEPAWHAAGHNALFYADSAQLMGSLLSPGAANDIFWKWHARVDEARYNWMAMGAPDVAQITTLSPAPGAVVTGPVTSIIIAFDNKVSAGIMDAATMKFTPASDANNAIQIKASRLTVNGNAATELFDGGGSTSRYTVFEFRSFTTPAAGTVTVVLTGTASYAGTNWTFTTQN